jgi:hypothetical protein
MSFVRVLRAAMVVVACCVGALPLRADELMAFHAAVEQALAEYRAAMATLETQGQEETKAAVNRLRQTWQSINDRFGPSRPAAFADDEQYSAMFLLVDTRLIGVLLVIDLGNRNAAREGLAPIEATLSRLSTRSAPTPR